MTAGGQPVRTARVLIIGGYGAFGARVAERLARYPNLDLVIGGRSAERCRAAARDRQLSSRPNSGSRQNDGQAKTASATISGFAIDAARPDIAALRGLAPAVIINASGPYQAQDYTLARAAIAIGAHYIDLADARDFVVGISVLDAEASAAGVLVTSGASSVPALSSAIVDHLAAGFSRLDAIETGIVPGNAYDPGIATAASILGQVGQPFTTLKGGRWITRYGWQGLRRVHQPGLGWRWAAPCNVPDLALFPARYPGVQTVDFAAGLEVGLMHVSMWGLSWLVRGAAGVGVRFGPEWLARPLMWLKRRLSMLGSDTGGMYVTLSGLDRGGSEGQSSFHVIARRNHGPFIPALAAVALTLKLVRGYVRTRGAMPCCGLVTLADFEAEAADLAIEFFADTPRR